MRLFEYNGRMYLIDIERMRVIGTDQETMNVIGYRPISDPLQLSVILFEYLRSNPHVMQDMPYLWTKERTEKNIV